MRRTLLLILFVPLLTPAQAPRQDDVWQPFKYFLGTWNGTGKGEPGISQLEREYKFVLGGKFLNVTHKSVYKPQEKNPKGETHEDWGFFSYDRRRKLHVFRQFHVEGFVTQYVSETTAPDGKTLVFTAESLENLPASWRARETYRILNNDEFIEVFELAAPGKEFSVYSENHFKRQKSAGVVLPISSGALPREREYTAFGNPERITIRSYSGHAMEPFITRDGRYLFFNNSNDPSADTNLHYARRINDVTFEYQGEIKGVNTGALDAVPTMDRDGNFYFVSTRSYKETLSTIYRGRFSDGIVKGVDLVTNISEKRPGRVNFDVEISAGGDALYFVDGIFSGKPVPEKADIAIAMRDGSGFRRWQKSTGLLKNINTDALEYAACISPDELELFFTRLGDNGLAIYRSTRKTVAQPFDLPERLVAIEGFVEAPTLAADGRSLYYHKKEGELFAIYRVTRKAASRP